ncbi:MAG: hypothetical protein LBT54_07615 [Bifidobacteriaceae bacterium]|jgi:hypothetical protein|nr:hypothetical protein [Bifidobacteriaceae bacterium]
MTQPARDADPICSARQCRARPAWALAWNNPALHAPGRRKVWLACSIHLPELRDFLEAGRGFTVEVRPWGGQPPG